MNTSDKLTQPIKCIVAIKLYIHLNDRYFLYTTLKFVVLPI